MPLELGDRPDPPTSGAEKEMLTGFLDFHRATLLWKCTGVSDADLRRSTVPSGTCLLGLVKHLAFVEQWWFRVAFGGDEPTAPPPWTDDDPDADFRVEPDETTEQILDLYRLMCEQSREVVAAASLDDQAAIEGHGHRSLRWILLHMVEETARHNGHADIIREQIDGATGE